MSYRRAGKTGGADALPFQSQYSRLAGEFLTDLAVSNPTIGERAPQIGALMGDSDADESFRLGCVDSLLKIEDISGWSDAQLDTIYSQVSALLPALGRNEENLSPALRAAVKFYPRHAARSYDAADAMLALAAKTSRSDVACSAILLAEKVIPEVSLRTLYHYARSPT